MSRTSPSAATFDLHGFLFESDLILDADQADAVAVAVHGHRSVRLVLLDALAEPGDVADVLLRAHSDDDDESLIELVRTNDGRAVFSFGDYRMRFSADLTVVEVAPGVDRDMDWLNVLVEGWMVAIMVFLSGRTVLHASSVLIDGVLVAFVGDSTQGKSTLAAGLCASGATLYGDDVLAVEPSAENPKRVFVADRGANALRLRPAAALFPTLGALGPHRPVGDRTVTKPPRHAPPQVPLRAIFIPWVSDTYTKPTVTWVSAQLAVVELMHYPRVMRWLRSTEKAMEFAGVAALAEVVPVAHLQVPPGEQWFPAVLDLIKREIAARQSPQRSPDN